MESKVLLIDAAGTEIGETYSRRARQLVKQQRAIWADDTHTAIRFMPDQEEEWETTRESDPTPRAEKNPEVLYAIAEKRIRDRRRMILHALALIPGYIAIAIIWAVLNNGRWYETSWLTMGFAWGMWTMYFIAHIRTFTREYSYFLRPKDWEMRRRLRLEEEVDRLKRMGYRE